MASDLQTEDLRVSGQAGRAAADQLAVALLTGGTDRHYTYGLVMSLVPKGVTLDVVGGPEVDGPEMHVTPGLNFLNFMVIRPPDASPMKKATGLLTYYARLMAYAWNARPKIFHILWNNRFLWFDRTVLTLYYKALGKKVVVTAHNVNGAKRDGRDSLLNRLTLKTQYHLADNIFVHTEKMKEELIQDFGVRGKAVTVIPYGINNAVPTTELTAAEAKRQLGISSLERTILFFGNVRPSKGLDYLLEAFDRILARNSNYRLIVAGLPHRGYNNYWMRLRQILARFEDRGSVIVRTEYVPDEEVGLYFKAADVLALPYTDIFQSGVLFLGYSFGLPVVATDVGSFREDVVEGQTGFLCRPRDSESLAAAIEKYFESDLFKELESRRQGICDYANARHSWSEVSVITDAVYRELAGANPA